MVIVKVCVCVEEIDCSMRVDRRKIQETESFN